MSGVYKVTAASVGKTKNGFEVYRLRLNDSFWATRLVPLSSVDRRLSKLYQLYIENNESLNFLVGKYISTYLSQSTYGVEFSSIRSFDVLQDFKKELDISKGNAFSTKLPIYFFLSTIGRNIEPDGSIKISVEFGDMRVSRINGINVCYQYDVSNEYLNLINIERVFDRFYKGVKLPPYDEQTDRNSYYKIDLRKAGIVKMNHYLRVSYKMTTSGDHDEWRTEIFKKLGDKLTEEQVQFLRNDNGGQWKSAFKIC